MSAAPPHDSTSEGDPLLLPDVAALGLMARGAVLVTQDGEIDELNTRDALVRLTEGPLLLCHRAFTFRRLAGPGKRAAPHPGAFDVMDLFAFVRPARAVLPTPQGLARALGLPVPGDAEDEALSLFEAARTLLKTLTHPGYPDREEALALARAMAAAGWAWGEPVITALEASLADVPDQRRPLTGENGLRIWRRLEEWEERAPPPPPSQDPIEPEAVRTRLRQLTGEGAEPRPAQSDYAARAAHAFAPKPAPGMPAILLAEAGTGIGKTLGYLAPASLWSETNKGPVWISTYTKNLQRQLDQETQRLFPEPDERAEKVVLRKGRENYLCLLNLEEAANRLPAGSDFIATALIARWALYSRDGDMVGGDFPSWLPPALGRARLVPELTDRRGECVYSACPHYKKCFIEKALRKARHASLVIANHALVLHRAGLDFAFHTNGQENPPAEHAAGAEDEMPDHGAMPPRLIFDEGHHLFDAADSAFSGHLSGLEGADLRRWLRGPEAGRRARARGLSSRIGDLVAGNTEGEEALDTVTRAAQALPGPGWGARLNKGEPHGPAEAFLAAVHLQVRSRAGSDGFYSIECDTHPLAGNVEETAPALDGALSKLERAMLALADVLRRALDEEAATLETATRVRFDAAIRGLDRRAKATVAGWRLMLKTLMDEAQPEEEPDKEAPRFSDWFSIERQGGQDIDVGMHRHWIDPTEPLADAVLAPAPGVLITSATLRDERDENEAEEDGFAPSWAQAELRTGASHLPLASARAYFASPFDYADQSRIFVVRDVDKKNADAVAAAYRELFIASGGGALGLFTAIARLQSTYSRIAEPLEEAALPLYAQHVDAMDNATLVDIFRAEEKACLLGTDAMRDGVDVPGRSLRMIVFDRTPWPRPDILHRARRDAFGGRKYDEMLVRLRLKQAFGRLIRSKADRGVFVLLDPGLPTRLTTAFPPDVPIERLGLAETIERVKEFL